MASLDLFCGAGGWGAHQGIDTDPDVAVTRANVGLQTLTSDVSLVSLEVKVSCYRQVGDAIPRHLADQILGAMS